MSQIIKVFAYNQVLNTYVPVYGGEKAMTFDLLRTISSRSFIKKTQTNKQKKADK